MKTKPTHQTVQTEWEQRFTEDFKRKDWTSDDWKNSLEDIDRTIWYISSLSPHNLWKAREAIRDLFYFNETQTAEDICKLIDDIELQDYSNISMDIWKLFKRIRNKIRDTYEPEGFQKEQEEDCLCHCHGNDPKCELGEYKIHCSHCKVGVKKR